MGRPGCGKTTTLRMIAGLETVTSGSIKIGDREVSQLPASKRGIGVGFESYALYPPMSIRENLLYGLKARKVKGADQMVASISKRLEMDDMMHLRPAGLSSGQKQRVALARALVRNPPVLLLDEPLSHLDASARQRVRRELKVLQREFGYTTIVVTHDQVEALSLADRLAVMDAGVVQQFGTPDEVFDDPANLFVAEFVGEPQINVLPRRRQGRRTAEVRVEIGSNAGGLDTAVTDVADGTRVTVGIRPRTARLTADAGEGIATTVAYFEHLLEFGLATSTVAGMEEGIVVQTPAPGELRARAASRGHGAARTRVPVRQRIGGTIAMTKLFNDPARFTEDMLVGFLDANARYVAGRSRRSGARAQDPPGKVAVVIGGGSGHYPAFCGTVGPGFADGAVVGNIFTSPSAEEAASVARAAHGDAGVLLTTGNYAGDVMNFGLAVTQLRSEGIDAQYFAVTDDIASAPQGRRDQTPWDRRRFHRLQVCQCRRRGRPRPGRRGPGRRSRQRRDPHAGRRIRRVHAARRGPAAVHRSRGADGRWPGHPRRAGCVRGDHADGGELARELVDGVLATSPHAESTANRGDTQRTRPHQVRGAVRRLG